MKHIFLLIPIVVLTFLVHLDQSGTSLPVVLLGMALVQGAVLLVAAATLSNAKWIELIKRPLLALTPLLFLFPFLVTLAPYPWLLRETAYLNHIDFIIRGVVALFVLATIGICFQSAAVTDKPSTRQWAVAYILTFAVVKTLVAMDWVMSFEYPWTSTMFPAIYMIECLYAGLALAAIIYFVQERQIPGSTGGAVYDTASLLFGFALFWGGLTFAQYLTIWYGNIPEEVLFFTRRFALPGGTYLFITSIILLFGIPFIVFLIHHARKSAPKSAGLAFLILVGLLVERLFHILPYVQMNPVLFVAELVAMLGIIAVVVYRACRPSI